MSSAHFDKAENQNFSRTESNNNENEPEKKEKLYARVFNQSDFKGKAIDDLTFYECDYTFRCVCGLFGGKQVRLKDLGKEITIGCSETKCNLYLEEKKNISPEHCRLTYIDGTFYYMLEDLDSQTGTWMKILTIEDGYEITESTDFELFQHAFTIDIKEPEDPEDKRECYLRVTKGPKKGVKRQILRGNKLEIGKKAKDDGLTLEIDLNEPIKFVINNLDDKIYISDETNEYYEGGLFFRISSKRLVRAGDVIKIGSNYFKFLSHNHGSFHELGDRVSQEDKLVICDDLRISNHIVIPYYAIYDGHGGPSCSEFIKKHLHNEFHYYLKYKKINESKNFLNDLVNALQEMIIFVDINYYESEPNYSAHHGSTCVFLFFLGNLVLCGNLGDSVSILVKNKKNNGKRIYLSRDFNPQREKEKLRIEYKKGFITNDGRLLGTISVSRAFGDWKYKEKSKMQLLKKGKTFDEYLISNRAEFRIIEISPKEDKYIIIASDGLFQKKDNKEEIFEIIDRQLESEPKDDGLKNIPNIIDNVRLELLNSYYSDASLKGTIDNMTLILLSLFNEGE